MIPYSVLTISIDTRTFFSFQKGCHKLIHIIIYSCFLVYLDCDLVWLLWFIKLLNKHQFVHLILPFHRKNLFRKNSACKSFVRPDGMNFIIIIRKVTFFMVIRKIIVREEEQLGLSLIYIHCVQKVLTWLRLYGVKLP